jgi:GntP family gluconate:H+ symporter
MRLRTGKDYLLFIMAICCGGVVTHSLMAPHPGPLAMAEALRLDLGLTILVGFCAGILPTFASYSAMKYLNRRIEIPLRETPGASLDELENIARKPESELPSFFWSIVPVILPMLLIALASGFAASKTLRSISSGLNQWIEFAGNRNVALIIGAIFAVGLLKSQKRIPLMEVSRLMTGPLETAGMIILITSAGGAFGLMLRNAGVGAAIQALVAGKEVNLILLAWLVSGVIRVAQGSATVAMLATASMLSPLITPALPYHPVYIFLAIGFGAMICSWMNDSGFWVVGRLSGFTEKETLKTWTLAVTINSVTGLIVTLLGSWLIPMKGLMR